MKRRPWAPKQALLLFLCRWAAQKTSISANSSSEPPNNQLQALSCRNLWPLQSSHKCIFWRFWPFSSQGSSEWRSNWFDWWCWYKWLSSVKRSWCRVRSQAEYKWLCSKCCRFCLAWSWVQCNPKHYPCCGFSALFGQQSASLEWYLLLLFLLSQSGFTSLLECWLFFGKYQSWPLSTVWALCRNTAVPFFSRKLKYTSKGFSWLRSHNKGSQETSGYPHPKCQNYLLYLY